MALEGSLPVRLELSAFDVSTAPLIGIPFHFLPRCFGAPMLKVLGTSSLILACLLVLTGCSNMIASATNRLAGNLSSAILNQDDVETVKAGAPAFLLLIDGFIEENPKNSTLLMRGARLYGAYAAAFVSDGARSKRLTRRALDYATRALCQENTVLCGALDRPYREFARALNGSTKTDSPALYTWSIAKLGWIQAYSNDWNAIAALPKAELTLQRIVKLDPEYGKGAPYLYLGILATLRPPSLGGKPAEAKQYFERAIELSGGHNLTAKVEYAKRYARLVFNRKLHDRLLREVLAAKTVEPGQTLMNVLAKQQARKLLATSADYF
jgi:tetratricopeptide (TPR) repeat protein